MMHEWVHYHDKAANHQLHQLPHRRNLLNHPNSFHGGLFKLNEKSDANHCSTCSVILSMMATRYTSSLDSVYCPHWLVQWRHHCSHSSTLSSAARLHQCHTNHSHHINNGYTFSGQTSYNPTCNVWRFHFLHILTNICFNFFILAIVVRMKRYLVVLIWLSLMTSEAGHLFMC